MKLDNKVVVITGGASGLGFAVTSGTLTKYTGSKVAVLDFNEAQLGPLLKQYPDRLILIKTDVTNDEEVKKAFGEIINKFKQVHILISCAGIAGPSKLLKKDSTPQPLTNFQKVIDVNLLGSINVMRWFTHHLVSYAKNNNIPLIAAPKKDETDQIEESLGAVVFISSVAAQDGVIGQTAYSGSKGGVCSMTLPLARELATSRIRVNTVAPGVFMTPMMKTFSPAYQQSLVKQVPFPNRLGDVDEFANCIFFLCENEYMNGSVVRIDGALRMAQL